MRNDKWFLRNVEDKYRRGKIPFSEYEKLKKIFCNTDFKDSSLYYISNESPNKFTSPESNKKHWLEEGNVFFELKKYPEAIVCYYKAGWKKTPVFRPGMNSTTRAIHYFKYL